MRLLKKNVILRLLNSYLVDSPQPTNISYLWNFGSLLAICLIIQILTGAFLAMHYTPNVDLAFNSIEHIMRDVNNGWLIRYTHANVASFFFIFVYALIYKFIINNNLFFYNWPLLNIEKSQPIQRGSDKKPIYLKGSFTGQKLASSKLLGLFYSWLAKSYNQIIKLCKLTLSCYLFFKKALTYSLIKFCDLKIRPLDFFTQIFTTSGLDYTDLGWFLNQNIIFNKTRRPGGKKWDDKFLQWFIGFTDAEGCFLIQTKNKSEVHFCFKITLHIDDSAVLFLIKDKLGIGVVSIKGNSCTFSIHSFQHIVDVLVPIFDKYPLITHKQLDYRDWRIAVLLKKNSAASNKSYFSIAPETFNKIVKMKENINRNRTNFDGYKISYLMISNYWFLGFVEGDGSFFLCNNRAIFSITHKDRQVLEAISLYIQTIQRAPIFKGLFFALHPNCIISGKNNNTAYQLIISDTDVLFQYIFPFFKDLPFLSRKGVDFKIWSVGLFLIIQGYTKIPTGKAIFLKLYNNLNSKRYFSNILDFINIEEINALFEIEPPFNIYSKKSHFILSKEHANTQGSRKGYNLHIYKDGEEIPGSPFNSYREGGKAIGLPSVSSICNYINTGKVFKDGYTFFSSPINNSKFKK